jgi:two-component system NtrC family response regulator
VEEGFLAFSEILQEDNFAKIIIVTGRGEKEYALKAIERGAYDFFSKPIKIDEFKVVLQRAFYLYQLEKELGQLKQSLWSDSFGGMLGTSVKMQEVYAAIRKVAMTDFPVLITGESGTGKEVAARAIHQLSSRKNNPFIVINCGAIPETLLESELFGHEKGAFTGAHIQRRGRIEMAQGGTLFLDEIGELTLPLQVKLLRFLQEQKIERIGGRAEIRVDARVLAATNIDLKQATISGRFREDLYYRINVIMLPIPPLRERDGDIELLATVFLQKYAAQSSKKIFGLTAQALRAIENHLWPGNIRELENRIKRAVIMAGGERITPDDLELKGPFEKFKGKSLKEAREGIEREMIQNSLMRNKGNITKVAAELDITRPTLYDLMGKLEIQKEKI